MREKTTRELRIDAEHYVARVLIELFKQSPTRKQVREIAKQVMEAMPPRPRKARR